jgi:signal transduction histidine kinase
MTTTPTGAPHLTSQFLGSPSTIHGDQHIARNLAITVGASAIVLAGLAGVQYLRTQPIETSGAAVTSVQALEAFAPGGSVYAQQVPTAAMLPALEAFAPGGSVYAQQVPTAAMLPALEAFAPGGSVYSQQVPTAPPVVLTAQASRWFPVGVR